MKRPVVFRNAEERHELLSESQALGLLLAAAKRSSGTSVWKDKEAGTTVAYETSGCISAPLSWTWDDVCSGAVCAGDDVVMAVGVEVQTEAGGL